MSYKEGGPARLLLHRKKNPLISLPPIVQSLRNKLAQLCSIFNRDREASICIVPTSVDAYHSNLSPN